MQSRLVYGLIYVAAVLSLGHHVDHITHGNDVGWLLTDEVTPFRSSFGIYPLILLDLDLYRSGRVDPRYWALPPGAGALFLAVIHFCPSAIEPPTGIVNLYEPRIIGWFAFAWLAVCVTVLTASTLYEARPRFRQRERRWAT